MICFNEFDGEKGWVTRITQQEAITWQRQSSIQVRGVDVYDTDELALEDFMVIHWAWEEDNDSDNR